MGSEDVEVQCQTQSASASVPCESATSYGIASVPFVGPMSAPSNQAGTPTPASSSTAMLAPSATSHTPPQNMAVQPSVAASPLSQVQVIQQPLQNQYLQHVYAPQQQHMFLPGNLTIQPTLQSIGGTPGISLQLQGKTMDTKQPTIISAAPMQSVGNFNPQSLMTAGGQMAAGAKNCVQGQMLAASSKSTAVIQGQSGFIPATTANQTVVIGQLGVLSNQTPVMQHQAKAIADSQKGKSYLISQPATLHPKSPILPSPNVSCAGQMIATNQLKQLPSAPHIISSQAPTMIASQAQILGSLQALGASIPQSITWAAPGSLHSPALFGQNPIFIRSQQSDMFIQSPPQQATIHAVPVAPAPPQQAQQPQHQPPPSAPPPQPPPSCTPVPQLPRLRPVRPASSVATQTNVSTSSATHTSSTITKTQSKLKIRPQQCRTSPSLSGAPNIHLQTATTQTQTQPPPSQKADAANQTRPTSELKCPPSFTKMLETYEIPTAVENAVQLSMPEVIEPEVIPTVEPEEPLASVDVAVVAPSSILQLAQEMPMEIEEVVAPVVNVHEPIRIPVEKVIPNRKEVEADNIGIVAPMTEVKEKQPQKAIVKPHVLTHVIEGFVIQEGSEPFPVNVPSYGLPLKNSVAEEKTDPGNVPKSSDIIAISKKKEKIPKIGGPIELAKCEFCGKLGPKSKFKRSKRFCSTSCAKRYTIGCSKRLAIVLPEQEQKSVEEIRRHKKKGGKKFGKSKKKKLGMKSKKIWKKSENKHFNMQEWNEPGSQELPTSHTENKLTSSEEQTKDVQEPNSNVPDAEVMEIPSAGENSFPSDASQLTTEEERSLEPHLDFATKSPLKWTNYIFCTIFH